MHELHVVTPEPRNLVVPMHSVHRDVDAMQLPHRFDRPEVAGGHSMQDLHNGPGRA